MHPVWAQRREEVLRDCLVSPDVFHQMVDRLAEFVIPYQHVLETEACQRNVYLGFPGVLEKFLAVDFNYPYIKALQTPKRHGLCA